MNPSPPTAFNDLDNLAFSALCERLALPTSRLRLLNFSNHGIGEKKGKGRSKIQSLHYLIEKNTQISNLNLENNNLKTEDLMLIMDALNARVLDSRIEINIANNPCANIAGSFFEKMRANQISEKNLEAEYLYLNTLGDSLFKNRYLVLKGFNILEVYQKLDEKIKWICLSLCFSMQSDSKKQAFYKAFKKNIKQNIERPNAENLKRVRKIEERANKTNKTKTTRDHEYSATSEILYAHAGPMLLSTPLLESKKLASEMEMTEVLENRLKS
ncbi:MAG: hypothetical protein ACKOAD_09285 [Gammaproteobacteria bacterium]